MCVLQHVRHFNVYHALTHTHSHTHNILTKYILGGCGRCACCSTLHMSMSTIVPEVISVLHMCTIVQGVIRV